MTKKLGLFGLIILVGSSLLILTFLQEGRTDVRLANFPQSEEYVASVDIPLPLYQLAEALLGNGQKKFSLLNKLLNESEGLSLNKA